MALEDAGKEVDVAFTREDPKGLAYENPFAGVPSFLRRKLTKDLSDIDLAITGIPFDQAVTHRAGTRFGPRAVREASTMIAGDAPYGWGFSPLEEFAMADHGDMAFDYARPAEVPGLIERHIASVLNQGAACLTLGGDHSITLPILRAHVAKHGPLALCQIDAHPDTWTDDDAARGRCPQSQSASDMAAACSQGCLHQRPERSRSGTESLKSPLQTARWMVPECDSRGFFRAPYRFVPSGD